MTGEVSIGGVYMPALVFLGLVTLVVFAFLSSLMTILGLYRLFAHRPLVDAALLVIVLGVVVAMSSNLQSTNL